MASWLAITSMKHPGLCSWLPWGAVAVVRAETITSCVPAACGAGVGQPWPPWLKTPQPRSGLELGGILPAAHSPRPALYRGLATYVRGLARAGADSLRQSPLQLIEVNSRIMLAGFCARSPREMT